MSRSRSASVWTADTVILSLDVPAGTVGGRIAGTRMPWRASASDAAKASSAAPTIIGMMGLGWLGRIRSMLARSRFLSLSPSSESITSMAAAAAAAAAGWPRW